MPPVVSSVILLLVVAGACAPLPAEGRVWVVRKDGLTLFDFVQDAVNVAAPGDTIDVGPGLYYEQVEIVDKTLLIRGSGMASTVIDGQHDHGHVLALRGQANYTEIRGVTIRGGQADTGSDIHGGVYGGGVLGDGATFALVDCRITDSFAQSLGGGIYATSLPIVPENGGSPADLSPVSTGPGPSHSVITLRRCVIDGNLAGAEGGGLCFERAYFVIEDCAIKDNEAGHGAGARLFNSIGRMSTCLVWKNDAFLDGGGLDVDQGLPFEMRLQRNTIVENTAGRDGSAAFITLGASIIWDQNIFALNGGTAGSVIACDLTEAFYQGSCNHFWSNAEPSLGDCVPLPSDTSGDPFFCNAAGGDFRLCESSPALSDVCGPRGALGIGCTGTGCATRQTPMTWGGIKSLFSPSRP